MVLAPHNRHIKRNGFRLPTIEETLVLMTIFYIGFYYIIYTLYYQPDSSLHPERYKKLDLTNAGTQIGIFSTSSDSNDSISIEYDKIKLMAFPNNAVALPDDEIDGKIKEKPVRYSPYSLENLKKLKDAPIEAKRQILSLEDQKKQALNIFRLLNVYNSPKSEHFNELGNIGPVPGNYLGIKHDKHYCDMVDTYNLVSPDNIYTQMNFINDDLAGSIFKIKILPSLGKDMLSTVNPSTQQAHTDMDITTNAFFIKNILFYYFYNIYFEFGCISQIYSHIPGSGAITRKDLLFGAASEYTTRYQGKPVCFNSSMYFPQSYRLHEQTECWLFFHEIDSKEYRQLRNANKFPFTVENGHQIKKNSGAQTFNFEKEQEIRFKYKNGTLCGEVHDNLLIIKEVEDFLLLDQKKEFNITAYMLVSSVNPMIVYYHDGLIKISEEINETFGQDKNGHLLHKATPKEHLKKTENEESKETGNDIWSFNDLQDYLLKNKAIKNNRWIDEYLRPQLKQAFTHIMRMTESKFMNNSAVFEMFEMIFTLDTNLNLLYIKSLGNPPLIEHKDDSKDELIITMLKDMFEIQFAYLRGRWKRILAFIDVFQKDIIAKKSVQNVSTWRRVFADLNINKLEAEFNINKNNSWSLIMDKNLSGKEAYFGHLDEKCVDDDDLKSQD